jgi:hypothetical protein
MKIEIYANARLARGGLCALAFYFPTERGMKNCIYTLITGFRPKREPRLMVNYRSVALPPRLAQLHDLVNDV